MENVIKVLMVEDDKIDQMAFERLVRQEQLPYDYTVAGSVAEARQVLESQNFDVVITDYNLGDGTAFDLLEPVVAETPFVFVTGTGDEEIAVKAIQAGADDYLIKDQDRNYLKVLPVTVDHVIERREDKRAAEQMREDLIRTMVHDLRSPLGAIFTSLEFLNMDAADVLAPEHRQVLEIASNNAQRMLKLINSILDVSRLESGQLLLNRVEVRLDNLVAEILLSYSPLAIEKDLRLENDVPSSLPPAWADVELVGRVLQNLVSNAIKFTPSGGTVRVTAGVGEQEKGNVLLVGVSDTGPGIPPEVRDRLFQKFATGMQKERGSGLGLAFCKLVVEAHGGRIWVESQPGQGATFTFSLTTPPVSGTAQE